MEAGATEQLQRIEHIVVLQLENRSFDHMLGYLALPGNELPSHGELDNVVNGFGGEANSFNGVDYPPEPLDEDAFDRHDLDPPHDADEVARHFCVCDGWFCAVPGPTMPNRFFSVAGTHDGEMSNVKLLVHKGGSFKSLFQELHS